MIETISYQDVVLCIIVKAEYSPERTQSITPPDYKQQIGFVVYPEGGVITRHYHRPLERHITGTAETILIRQGRCILDVYNAACELVASRELCTGDIMVMVSGGHGFRMLEDTVLFEIKTGPYTGMDEKVAF